MRIFSKNNPLVICFLLSEISCIFITHLVVLVLNCQNKSIMECFIEPEIELKLKSFEVNLHFVGIHLNEPIDDLSEYQIQIQCLNERLIASKVNDVELKLEYNTSLDYVLNIRDNSFATILSPIELLLDCQRNET